MFASTTVACTCVRTLRRLGSSIALACCICLSIDYRNKTRPLCSTKHKNGNQFRWNPGVFDTRKLAFASVEFKTVDLYHQRKHEPTFRIPHRAQIDLTKNKKQKTKTKNYRITETLTFERLPFNDSIPHAC